MELDINKIRSLDEAQLSALIYAIVISMGANETKARNAASNASSFKQMLANASEKDIKKIVGTIGEERAKNILSQLNL